METGKRVRSAFSSVHAPDDVKRKALYAIEARRKGTVRRRIATTFQIACACVAGVLIFINIQIYGRETAYVSLDVNPSISLAINDFGRVIEANAYGGRSSALVLEEAEVKNQPYEKAVELLLTTKEMQRCLADSGSLWISIQSNNPQTETQMEIAVQSAAAGALADSNPDTVVTSGRVTEDVRVTAEDAGLTATKYVAIAELQAVDPSVTIEGYKDATIWEIHQETQSHHAEPSEIAQPGSEAIESVTPQETASVQPEPEAAETPESPQSTAATGHHHEEHHGWGHD